MEPGLTGGPAALLRRLQRGFGLPVRLHVIGGTPGAREIDVVHMDRDALEHVRRLRLQSGSTLVVWHSATWPLPGATRDSIRDELQALGAGATTDSPLAHISLEPISHQRDAQHRFTLAMTTWPGLDGLPPGVQVPWGTTPPSGEPVTWSVPCAGAIVRDPHGRILLVRRGQQPAVGLWSIPGGRIDGDESWDAAAAREVREETGIEASGATYVGLVERDSGAGSTYLIADFLMTGDGEPRAGDDADDARWCTPEEILDLPTSPGLVEALREWGLLA